MRFRSGAGGTLEVLDVAALFEPTFVGLDAVEDGRKLTVQAQPLIYSCDGARGGIAPTQLLRKGVPDAHLHLVRPMAVQETPFQNLFVGAAFRGPPEDLGMLQIKETREDTVERIIAAKVLPVVIGKFSAEVESDLINHAAEVNEASYFVAWAPERWMFHVLTLSSV
jgi:hypothetical protein